MAIPPNIVNHANKHSTGRKKLHIINSLILLPRLILAVNTAAIGETAIHQAPINKCQSKHPKSVSSNSLTDASHFNKRMKSKL